MSAAVESNVGIVRVKVFSHNLGVSSSEKDWQTKIEY